MKDKSVSKELNEEIKKGDVCRKGGLWRKKRSLSRIQMEKGKGLER